MKGALITLFIFSLVAFLVVSTVIVVRSIQFDRGCGGYLKRAADANTVELATVELSKAVKYLEDNKLTEGFTSIIYTTPDEDVGFLYTNLKNSLEELKDLPANATPLERSNMLMKLRETILDEGQSTTVTLPTGISRFPNNAMFALTATITLIMSVIFGCFVAMET